jgi:peptidoglycan/LPS O-acetylase OafA/YrhL
MGLRIASLDLLRGLAACAVVIFHWQWLYADPAAAPIAFHYVFYPIYETGYLAVDLFFALSGFILFRMYGERLARRQISVPEFWWNRFTRLYPLHLATLLLIAAVQPIYCASHGADFIYQDNGPTQFVLQLFLASNWPPNAPFSFNGPIWSVSIEILLYALFFMQARYGLARPWHAVAMVLIGSTLIAHANLFGRGVMAFYIGALCYFTVEHRRAFKTLAVAVAGAAFIQAVHRGLLPRDAVAIIIGTPAIILGFALNEQRLRPLTSGLRWLGEISYSTYLLHFPIMLVLVTIGAQLNPASHIHMILYLASVILLALMCFRFFERPVQNLLRGLRDNGSSARHVAPGAATEAPASSRTLSTTPV